MDPEDRRLLIKYGPMLISVLTLKLLTLWALFTDTSNHALWTTLSAMQCADVLNDVWMLTAADSAKKHVVLGCAGVIGFVQSMVLLFCILQSTIIGPLVILAFFNAVSDLLFVIKSVRRHVLWMNPARRLIGHGFRKRCVGG